MKLLKMRIRRTNEEGHTHYEYPQSYDAHKVAFGPIYESGLPEIAKEAQDRDADDEFIIIGVKEADLAQFLKSNTEVKSGHTFTTVELTKEEAVALGGRWTKQTEKMDDKIILPIVAKVARGEKLSQKEKDALDPNHKEPGITKTKSFAEDLDEYLKIK
jgi:hypothetical protein